MKNVVLLAPVVSLLLLAAHFLRAQAWVPLGLCLGLPALLLWRSRWAARTAQCGLLLGAIEWLRTLIALGVGALRARPALRAHGAHHRSGRDSDADECRGVPAADSQAALPARLGLATSL